MKGEKWMKYWRWSNKQQQQQQPFNCTVTLWFINTKNVNLQLICNIMSIKL